MLRRFLPCLAPAGLIFLHLSSPAAARPANCLLVVEGKTAIDGACEFDAEPDGSFTIVSGRLKANVMVDPNARSGRAFYEDSSPRGGSFVIGDVVRDGACWRNSVARLCAWSPGARPASAGAPAGGLAAGAAPAPAAGADPGAASPAPPSSADATWSRQGPWRITVQSNSSGFVNCRASRDLPNGEMRFSLSPTLVMAMSVPLGAAPAQRVPARLTAGRESDDVRGFVNAEGRLIVEIAPPLGREMVEQAPRQIRVESPAGASSYPVDGFRAVWDELNSCVEARGQAPAAGSQQAAAGQPPAAPAAGAGLTAGSFRTIVYADLEKWNSSGCSFSLSRSKNNVALFDTQDPKKTAVFKIDGKLIFVPAKRPAAPGAYWSGTVAGHEVRMIKGRKNPAFKNDGGGEGGEGRLEWSGPSNGSLAATWEEGC